MERTGFWTRMGGWFRPSRRNGGEGGTDLMSGDQLSESASGSTSIEGSGSRVRLLRNPHLERLEEEYGRVVQLMDSVRSHLEQQGERADLMARSLDRVADAMGGMPEVWKTHLETVSAIRDHLGTTSSCVKRIDENLSQLPQIADAQRETMVSIGRQLDGARQADERIASVLQGCENGLTKLADATGASVKALQELRWDTAAREERVAVILREQSQRFRVFAWAALALAAVAAGLGLVGLFR